MPERETPVGRGDRTPPSSPYDRRNQPSTPPSTTRGKGVVVIGAPGDVPRALEHPAVASGRLSVVAAVAVEIGDDGPGTIDGLASVLRESAAQTILIAGSIGTTAMRQVADLANLYRCDLLAVMSTEVLAEHDPVIVWSGDYPLVQLSRPRLLRLQASLKRWLDVITSAVGLVVCTPLLAALMGIIRLESPGPAVFRHERVGHRGKRFLCLKLRTMRTGAEAQLRSNPEMYEEYVRHHFKIPEDKDPRITKLGRFLRKSSLDELPQLWNVLVGEMSLVGPRPVVEDELKMYGEDRNLVLSVKPGLTGAWAVSGRQAVGYPERCDLELQYVRDQNLLLDARIIVKTAGVVLGGRGVSRLIARKDSPKQTLF